jgi:hypothetical protein
MGFIVPSVILLWLNYASSLGLEQLSLAVCVHLFATTNPHVVMLELPIALRVRTDTTVLRPWFVIEYWTDSARSLHLLVGSCGLKSSIPHTYMWSLSDVDLVAVPRFCPARTRDIHYYSPETEWFITSDAAGGYRIREPEIAGTGMATYIS